MENINNSELPPSQTPTESQLPPIKTLITLEPTLKPPKSNIFKYLFIICFVVLLAAVIYSFFLIKNLNSKLETKQDITEVTPTAMPTEEVVNKVTPTATNSKISAYSKSDNGTTNLILNKDGKETIIDSLVKDKNDQFLDDELIHFGDIKFSNSFRYLSYSKIYASVGSCKIYDIKNNSFVDSFEHCANFTITNGEKYLIYCQSGGEGAIEGRIISLPDSNVKFDFVKHLGNKIVSNNVNCSYDSTSNIVTFTYYKDDADSIKAGVRYNLNTNSVE